MRTGCIAMDTIGDIKCCLTSKDALTLFMDVMREVKFKGCCIRTNTGNHPGGSSGSPESKHFGDA